jgi:CHAD domain-containing protein
MPTRAATLQSTARINTRVQRLLTRLQALLALPSPAAADIHQLRRNTKKLRAWLKLRRNARHGEDSRQFEAMLRANAARFSAGRDALVRLQTLEQLPALAGDRPAPGLPLPRCHALLASVAPPAGEHAATATLQQLDEGLQQLMTDTDIPSAAQLAAALRKTYGKARKRLKQARASGNEDDLHAFRRWAKYLCYQLELVCVLERGALAKLQRSLDTLCSRLGSWNDLVVLGESLQALRASTNMDAALLLELDEAERLCRKAQGRLLQRCLRVAGTCFKSKASKLPLP